MTFSFAALDTADSLLQQHSNFPIRTATEIVLKIYCCNSATFTYDAHVDWGLNTSTKIIANIYYNNKQVIGNNEVQKDAVASLKKDSDQRHEMSST